MPGYWIYGSFVERVQPFSQAAIFVDSLQEPNPLGKGVWKHLEKYPGKRRDTECPGVAKTLKGMAKIPLERQTGLAVKK